MTLEEIIAEVKALREDVEALKKKRSHKRSARRILEEMEPLTLDNPLFSMIGMGKSGKGDISQNKYKYLLEGEQKLWQPGGQEDSR